MSWDWLWSLLLSACRAEDERSLLDGAELIGDLNFRTGEFDCGTDPGGYYEDDL